MNSVLLRFSLVRLVADAPRRVTVPIGVLVEYGGVIRSRFISEITPQLRVLAAPMDRGASLRFGKRLQAAIDAMQIPSLTALSASEWSGFIVDPPREIVSSGGDLDSEADLLYREFVAPRQWREPIRRRTRLATQLRQDLRRMVLGSSSPAHPSVPIELGVQFRAPGLDPYEFDAALANGHLTLVKSVDLSVQGERQRLHTSEAIAEVALIRSFIDDPQLEQIAVTNPSAARAGGSSFVRALQQLFGAVFLYPEQREELRDYVLTNANDDVSLKAEELGLSASITEGVLYLERQHEPEVDT